MPRNIFIGYEGDGLIRRAQALAAANREQAEKEKRVSRDLAKAKLKNKPIKPLKSQIPGFDENRQPNRWINYDELKKLGVVPVVWRIEDVAGARRITVRNASNTGSVVLNVLTPVSTAPGDWTPGTTVTESGTVGTPEVLTSAAIAGGITPQPSQSYSSTGRTKYAEKVFQDSNEAVLVLPVNSTSAIFIYGYKAMSKTVRVELVNTLNQTFGYLESITDGADTWNLYGQDGSYSSNITINTYSANDVDEVRCVLVSKSSVREIATPAGLLTALDKFLKHPNTFPTADYLVGATGYSGTFRNTMVPVEVAFGRVYQVSITGSSTPGQEYYVPGPEYSHRPRFFEDYSGSVPLLLSYGLGSLTISWHPGIGNAMCYSPAVFSFLNNFDSGLIEGSNWLTLYDPGGVYDVHLSYEYIRTNYLLGAPDPGKFLAPCVATTGCPAGSDNGANPADYSNSYITFYETGVSPIRADTAVEAIGFRPATNKIRLLGLDGSETLTYAWDWGRASYCSEQLQALGFSSEDLVP